MEEKATGREGEKEFFFSFSSSSPFLPVLSPTAT
jgi:hypothetical protein